MQTPPIMTTRNQFSKLARWEIIVPSQCFTASWLYNNDTDLVEALKADTESNDFLMPRQNLHCLWTWKPIIPLWKSLTSQLSPTRHTNCSSRHSARCSVCRSRSCVKTRFKNRGGEKKKNSISVWLGEAKRGEKKKMGQCQPNRLLSSASHCLYSF